MQIEKERRIQYMLPHELHREKEILPLIFFPLAPLEWHGPHLVMGVDPINAECVALAVANKIGGVVLPTLYMGTERERPPETLLSLGFKEDDYIVGMDFPEAEGLYKSFYFPEELFAMVVREHINQCLKHGYKYIFIVNGHGAVNHNEVLSRLCNEFNGENENIKVAFALSFPEKALKTGAASHAGIDETSLMKFFDEKYADISKLPPPGTKLEYKRFSVVDSGGFTGSPGEGFAVSDDMDPRKAAPELGEKIFSETVNDICEKVKSQLLNF